MIEILRNAFQKILNRKVFFFGLKAKIGHLDLGSKHLKHQILTLDVKIWCWTSIWRFLTSNINFWRPKSNIWRPTSIFDVLRQIWRQYLMSSINIWCWTSNIWCWTSNIWCWTSNIWCCTSNIWCQTSNIDKGRQILMPDVKNHQIDVQHQNLTPYVKFWCFRCFTPIRATNWGKSSKINKQPWSVIR